MVKVPVSTFDTTGIEKITLLIFHLTLSSIIKLYYKLQTAGTDQESWIRQLFMDVQKRGPKAFGNLVGSLQGSGNCVAANILDVNIKIESLPSPIPEDTKK